MRIRGLLIAIMTEEVENSIRKLISGHHLLLERARKENYIEIKATSRWLLGWLMSSAYRFEAQDDGEIGQ